jgi:glycosyltransferase involved in cell wall biosynthesis
MNYRVSCMVFTLDEEVNLPHCLDSLTWCDDIIVVDSGSLDRTLEIARKAGARLFAHAFAGFGCQRNWALANTAPKHPWVLILDADERVTPELVNEINALLKDRPDIGAARLSRKFMMWGKWLRYSSQYPVWVIRLVHRDRVTFENRGHAETQHVQGPVAELRTSLIDENHKDLSQWWQRQRVYARADALFELDEEGVSLPWRDVFSPDPMARRMFFKRLGWKMPLRDWIYLGYSFLLRFGFLDGAAGWRFCKMRAQYQRMIMNEKRRLRIPNGQTQ